MMIEHMRIGGEIRCDLCLPRVTWDDCRDQDVMHGAAEAKPVRPPSTESVCEKFAC